MRTGRISGKPIHRVQPGFSARLAQRGCCVMIKIMHAVNRFKTITFPSFPVNEKSLNFLLTNSKGCQILFRFMITFESPRKRGNRFLFMLGLLGILTIASTILTVSEISLLEQNQAGEEVTYSDIVAPLANHWIISVRSLFWTSVFCAILFLMWKHRASKNLAPLGVSNQRFSPRWAVAYYFIPILNFSVLIKR